ncbi:MAG: hypothetical protein IJX99_04315 [Clostridia bacterium]|nr:hypothetical protein [Clostridia bacterium]
MKKQVKEMNAKAMFTCVMMLVMLVCFSPIAYANVAIYTEVRETERDGKTWVDSKTVLTVDTEVENRDGTKYTVADIIPGEIRMECEGTLENGSSAKKVTFIGHDAAGNEITLKNPAFVIERDDGTFDKVAFTSSIHYDEDLGFVLNFNGEFAEGDMLSIQYINEKGEIVVVDISEISGKKGDPVYAYSETVKQGEQGLLKTLWNLIVDTFNEVARLVEEIAVELLLPLGDGILYLVTASVGEAVSLDRLVFNAVGKVNIDYWSGITPGSKDVKAVMAGVVVPWYRVFYKIAIMVYIIVLIVVGIQVLLNSTAEKKAKYKEVMVSWVVGVMMLTLFPFVLKYVVEINDVAVESMYVYLYDTKTLPTKYVPEILKVNVNQAMKTFGDVEFVDAMVPGNILNEGKIVIGANVSDAMLQTRLEAQRMKKIALVGVYYILLGQMIVLLFMYYKRAFMIAFLITIFPLVAMTYVIDKIGDKKAQSFGIWFKEYIVNVVVQMFHAVVYVIIVGTGIETYVNDHGASWLFMIISVLFLFQGEKILRNIFGIKSSANTMADLAATGAAIYGISKLAGKGGGNNNVGSKQDNADVNEAANRQTQRHSYGASGASVPPPPEGAGGPGGPGTGGAAPENQGRYTGNDPAGVETAGYDEGAAQDTVIQRAMANRLHRGIASRSVNFAGKVVGVTAGATYGLSKGDTADGSGIKNAISDGTSGGMIGSAAMAPATAIVNKVEQKAHGEHLAKQIENGDLDNNLTLNAPPGAMMPGNIDPNEVVGKHGETMQEIYRKALAEMARTTATKGKARGEVAYWNYIEENMDNSRS